MRIVLVISYLGTAYAGWQVQPNNDTVEGRVRAALQQFTTQPLQLQVAGRTDTGVHAVSQLVHFDTAYERPWIRANDFLPRDIRIKQVKQVPSSFHARYGATGREYLYVMERGKIANPLNHNRTLHVPEALDIANIQAAAQPLIGTADFSTWRTSGCVARSAIKTVEHIKIEEVGQYLVIKIKANAFLYRMVRNLVGTLYLAGRGLLSPAQVRQLREKLGLPDFTRHAVPAHGLYFLGATYDNFPDITALCYNESKDFYTL